MDNQMPLILLALGGTLAAAVAGGAVLSLIAVGIGRFLNRNAPTDAAMAAFENQRQAKTAQAAPRERKPLSPNWEPLLISVAGFVLVYILAALFVRVPPPKTETAAEEAKPAASAALPSTGDLTATVNGLPAGDADSGAKLFASIGCSACHGLEKDQRLVGPSFYGLWGRAGASVDGLGAREYLYQSIVLPNEHVVDTYQSNLMPQNYSVVLNAQQVADLLAYIERDHDEK
jgi:cytochrome c2